MHCSNNTPHQVCDGDEDDAIIVRVSVFLSQTNPSALLSDESRNHYITPFL